MRRSVVDINSVAQKVSSRIWDESICDFTIAVTIINHVWNNNRNNIHLDLLILRPSPLPSLNQKVHPETGHVTRVEKQDMGTVFWLETLKGRLSLDKCGETMVM
jgi:hypothetical protein